MTKKLIIINFLVFIVLLIILELILGDWFSKYNFGYHMRDKRLITYKVNTTINENKYNFNYIRNFYGFRMNSDIEPVNIDYLFQGGSTGDEMPLPYNETIVGKLNFFLNKDGINAQIINASLSGKSTAGYNNDFKYWFPRLEDFKPKVIIFFSGHNDADIMHGFENNEKEFDIGIENRTFSNDFYKRTYDYITNNSFILIKLKKIKDLYFDLNRQKILYDLDKQDLYSNFSYVDYKTANKIYSKKPLGALQKKTISFYRENLKQLNFFIKKANIKPIFVTQARFDGISTHRLYLVNKETKEFCKKNNYDLIKLDELYNPDYNDFFDEIHTSPKGSLKFAKIIYPVFKEVIINLN